MKNHRSTLVISSFVIAVSMVALKPVNAKDLQEHGFECDPKNLYNHAPPPQSYGKDAGIVNKMTYQLGVLPISVYDVPGLKDAIAVKPVSGTTPMFKDDPKFEGIIVDSRHMDINVDVTREEIADMKRDKKDVPSFIQHGKERRYGLLAHEVAHMLLPADLYGLMGRNAEKKEIAAKSLRINIQEMLDTLHKMQPRFRDPDTARRLMNEMAADYVSGVILRYMNVGTHGITYMLTKYHAGSDYKKCWKSHPDPLERVKYIEAGYKAHFFE